MKFPFVSVVIPCYRSELSIEELVRELTAELPALCEEYEIILVNDCSPDDTWNVIQRVAAANRCVLGIDLMRNFGQQNALFTGIREASGEVVVTMDDDLQHPPAEIGKLLNALTENTDLVYGVPEQEKHGWFRDLSSVFMKRFLEWSLEMHAASHSSAFRAFRREVLSFADMLRGSRVDIDALLCLSTRRIELTTVVRESRKHGQSNYNLRKLISYTWNLIATYSTLPLRFALFCGILLLLGGVIALLVALGVYFAGANAVTMGIIGIIGTIKVAAGIQLFCLGLFGEYLARVYQQSMGLPISIIRSRCSHSDSLP